MMNRRFATCVIGILSLLALPACGGTDGGGDGDGSGGGGSGGSSGFSTDQQPNFQAPSTLSFPKVNIGESLTQKLRIRNTGQGALNLQTIELQEEGDDKREVRIQGDGNQTGVIQPDGEKVIDIQYAPVNPLEDNAQITIESNDSESPHTVDLNFQPLEPRLGAKRTVQFPSVRPLPDSKCDRTTEVVTLQNIGDSPLAVEQIQFGSDENFWVTYPDPNGSPDDSSNDDSNANNGNGDNKGNEGELKCDDQHPNDLRPQNGTWPVDGIDGELAPGDTMDVRVWFEPEDRKPAKSTLEIRWVDTQESGEGKWFEINLVANANTPCLKLEPEREVKFGQTTVGKERPQPVSIENCRPRTKPLEVNDISLTDDADGAFKIKEDSLPEELQEDGGTLTIDGNQARTFTVIFSPREASDQSYDGELVVKSNDPERSNQNAGGKTLDLVGSGTDNKCPTARAGARVQGNNQWRQKITTLPLKTVEFRSSQSEDPDGDVQRYEWTILKRPADSTRPLRPGPNDPNPTLKLDLAGEYKIELVVYDDEDAASCGEERAIITIQAVPQDDIHVQLVWDTPNDRDQTDSFGTDLDLHYVRPTDSPTPNWNDDESGNDIFWKNQTADWGRPGPDDNPSLDIDDTNGKGPENINHDNPNPEKDYKVGVHYYEDRGLGASYATVRIYLKQELRQEFERFMPQKGLFWYVADIDWKEEAIYPRDDLLNGFPTQQ